MVSPTKISAVGAADAGPSGERQPGPHIADIGVGASDALHRRHREIAAGDGKSRHEGQSEGVGGPRHGQGDEAAIGEFGEKRNERDIGPRRLPARVRANQDILKNC